MKFSTALLLAVASAAIASPARKRASNFVWIGANESGAEFGQGKIPGVLGTDYTFPSTSAIQTLINQGMNIFRVPFMMERMTPGTMTSPLNSAYFSGYSNVINYITSNGAYAIVDPHNFGRYNGNVFTSASDFQTFWATLAGQFKSNSKVIFDTNNEYNSEDQTNVLNMNQAAINGIRGAGATSQFIFAEGNQWTGAWDWVSVNGGNMAQLTDPQGKLIYEMHQYLDSDFSGTSATCTNTSVGQQALVGATNWLRSNGKLGFLGEFAGGVNSGCETAVTNMLNYMEQNSDVWLGFSWWGAGPWWGTYIYGLEPGSGVAYSAYMPILTQYLPSKPPPSGGGGGTTTTASHTTTTGATSTTTVRTTTTTSSGSSGSGAAHYGQCGGIGWNGPTSCVSPYTCNVLNPYYSQCL